jgi:cellulose synthase operon protein YhjQ
MSPADDVASLFQRFGASSDSYLEIESTFDYREPAVVQAPPVAIQARSDVQAAQLPIETSRDDPEHLQSTTRSSPGPLGHLLAEVALARQAEAAARTTEVLAQSLGKEPAVRSQAQVIAVISSKGGVGKSTLSAALATTVRLPGGLTAAIDLDSQNALQHHLSVSPDAGGLATASLTGENWRTLLAAGSGDTLLLRHGSQTQDERHALQLFLENDSQWLVRQIARMELNARDVLVLDVPCGDARLLEQALNAASQILVVITPDAACYLTLDELESRLESTLTRDRAPACEFVINRFDGTRSFTRDMAEVMVRRLGDRLLGLVHEDHALGEALAYGHNPAQAPDATHAVQDLLSLGNTLVSRLKNPSVQESPQP